MASNLLKGGAEGIQIKSLPVNPDVHSGWMHENDTDEQRRQNSIWSYIMTLTSVHNSAVSAWKVQSSFIYCILDLMLLRKLFVDLNNGY